MRSSFSPSTYKTARRWPSWVAADQLRHGREGTAGGTITAQPLLLVPPTAEAGYDRAKESSEDGPAQVAKQARTSGHESILMDQPDHRAARRILLTTEFGG